MEDQPEGKLKDDHFFWWTSSPLYFQLQGGLGLCLAGCSQLLFADLETDNQIFVSRTNPRQFRFSKKKPQKTTTVVFKQSLGLSFQIPPFNAMQGIC